MMEYPKYIEVPVEYWTISTTINIDFEENSNKYWHNSKYD